MEAFKEIIFTPRIIAFNESFVPLGKRSNLRPCAVIWHEALAGRSRDDMISTFYTYFLSKRDVKTMTIWLDNCSSQNKNWGLISFFMYIIVNCEECSIRELTIKYFEPGHTFMAADSFHHQVELSLKRRNKVYDFDDFAEVVQAANKSRVEVLKMTSFYSFTDYTSKYKLQKLSIKFYLKDVVSLQFRRNSKSFFYKTDFSDNFQESKEIFNNKFLKGSFAKPEKRTGYRGISKDRKANLIEKLRSHIPPTRLIFWENLPVNASGCEEADDDLIS